MLVFLVVRKFILMTIFVPRKLKKGNIVNYVWSSQGTVKVRRDSSSPIIKITHMEDLVSNFSDFDFYN